VIYTYLDALSSRLGRKKKAASPALTGLEIARPTC
jgi:hypothetical protein